MVEEKNTFRSVLIREVGTSLHFPVMTDVLFRDNCDSWISEFVVIAVLSPKGQNLGDRGVVMIPSNRGGEGRAGTLLPCSI